MSDDERASLLATIDGLLMATVIALESAPNPLVPLAELRRMEHFLRQMNARDETIDALRRVRQTMIDRAGPAPSDRDG